MITFACKQIHINDLIKCSFGLNKTSFNVLMHLLNSGETGATSVYDIRTSMDLERTTVQKAIKMLMGKNLLRRLQQNLGGGGYQYLYEVNQKEDIQKRMLTIVDNWYEAVKSEINLW